MAARAAYLNFRSVAREQIRRELTARSLSTKVERNVKRRVIAPGRRVVPAVQWPVGILEDAHKTGLVSLRSSEATKFLTEFASVARGGTPTIFIVRPLIRKYNIEPRILFWLGWILQKAVADDPALGSVAKLLQTTAATFQDEYASLILVESALRANKPYHSDIADAVKTLTDLSNQGNLFAKERLSALYEQRGDKQQALSLAEECLAFQNLPSSNQNFVLDPRFSAWKTVARLRSEERSLNPNQFDAIEHGAKILDDPDAYFDLAAKAHDLPHHQRFAYLLKAAATGDARAALAVGDWYLEGGADVLATAATASEGPNSASRASGFRATLASEWYELALKSPKHGSDVDKEEAGERMLVALLTLNDSRRCVALANEHSEMRWAKRFLSQTP